MLAAQWDPRRADSAPTPGSGPSVRLVEQALHAEGLLASRYVDGHYGTMTVTAYTAWQKRLGHRGLAANGIPGAGSLAKLGTNRFTVTKVVRPGARTAFHGVVVNERTRAMLTEAQTQIGPRLKMEQGSYSTSDRTSANRHAGGGAVDVYVDNLTARQRVDAVRELRKVGFAAWLRSPAQGSWGWHIHAIATSDPDLSPQAQHQVGDYYRGLNGLANQRPDDGPRVAKVTWEQYQRTH